MSLHENGISGMTNRYFSVFEKENTATGIISNEWQSVIYNIFVIGFKYTLIWVKNSWQHWIVDKLITLVYCI